MLTKVTSRMTISERPLNSLDIMEIDHIPEGGHDSDVEIIEESDDEDALMEYSTATSTSEEREVMKTRFKELEPHEKTWVLLGREAI